MKKSESIKEIATAMINFKEQVGKLKKTAKNPFFKSSYAPIGEVLETINEPLTKNGLSFFQFPKGENELETIVMHTSGEWICESYSMKPIKEDPQAFGSVITYQRRYALCAIFGIGDEDDDANTVSDPKKEKDDRPWLTEKQFNSALERIKTEDAPAEFVKKIEDSYRMKKIYFNGLHSCLEKTVEEKQTQF